MKSFAYALLFSLFISPFSRAQEDNILHAVFGFEATLEANQIALQKARERLRKQYSEALTLSDKTYRRPRILTPSWPFRN